jgi:hypothetical protein
MKGSAFRYFETVVGQCGWLPDPGAYHAPLPGKEPDKERFFWMNSRWIDVWPPGQEPLPENLERRDFLGLGGLESKTKEERMVFDRVIEKANRYAEHMFCPYFNITSLVSNDNMTNVILFKYPGKFYGRMTVEVF